MWTLVLAAGGKLLLWRVLELCCWHLEVGLRTLVVALAVGILSLTMLHTCATASWVLKSAQKSGKKSSGLVLQRSAVSAVLNKLAHDKAAENSDTKSYCSCCHCCCLVFVERGKQPSLLLI